MAWNEEARIRCRFQFTCPQLWSRLQPTEKDDVRRFSEQGRCIAVPVAREDEAADPDEPCWVVGLMERPYDAESDE